MIIAKNRVGLLTYHNVLNYGGALQTYALFNFLYSEQFDVKIIDYESSYFKKIYSAFYISDKNAKKFIYMLINLPFVLIRKNKFKAFRNKYYGLTSDVYGKENINKLNDEFDIFIAGSDQIWNFDLNDSDLTYFLDFADDTKKCISFSSSFGIDINKTNFDFKCIEYLNRFERISVREKKSADFLSNILRKEVSLFLDPVFLISSKSWEKIIDLEFKPPQMEYILIYKINDTDSFEIAEQVSELSGIKKVIVLQAPLKNVPFQFTKKRTDSPVSFLWLFKNAKYIITDSFHGTAFSIIFKKNFITVLDKKIDNRNERIINLLNIMDLSARLYNNNINKIFHDYIDFTLSDKIISNNIREVKIYFEELLNEQN